MRKSTQSTFLQRCGRKRKEKIKYREEWLKGFNSIISEYGYREKTRERECDESEDECKALSN